MSTQQTLAFLGHLPFTVGNCCETKSYQHEPMKYQFEKFYFLCNSLGIQKEYFNLHHLQSSLSTLKDYRSKMYLTRCAIWYYLHNLNPPWVFFTFFKLYKWYQIEERTTDATMEILLLEELVSKIKTNVLYSTTSLLNFLQLTS